MAARATSIRQRSIPASIRKPAFGRLRIPLGTREAVRVPAGAVQRVGQLDTVVVRDGDRFERRLVSTGAVGDDGGVEILTGLAGGETVGLPAETK